MRVAKENRDEQGSVSPLPRQVVSVWVAFLLQNNYATHPLCIMSSCHWEQIRTITSIIYAFGSFDIGMTHARKMQSSLTMTVINVMFRSGSISVPFNMTPALRLTWFPTIS